MVNESTYSFNPDEDKQDKMDIEGDRYEELQKDIDDYFKNVEKTGKIEGNLNEADDDCEKKDENADNVDNGSSDDKTDDKTDGEKKENLGDAMTPEEIIKKFKEKNEKLAAEQAAIANKVKKVEVTELYDGYVACDVTFNNGQTKQMEFEIDEDELQNMWKQIEEIAAKKKVEATLDDAAIAIIRKRLDPTDKLDWFYKPTNTSLDEWFAQEELERENELLADQNKSSSWAEQMGLFMDDNGDFGDDSSFKSWDDGSEESRFM